MPKREWLGRPNFGMPTQWQAHNTDNEFVLSNRTFLFTSHLFLKKSTDTLKAIFFNHQIHHYMTINILKIDDFNIIIQINAKGRSG